MEASFIMFTAVRSSPAFAGRGSAEEEMVEEEKEGESLAFSFFEGILGFIGEGGGRTLGKVPR